MLIVGHLPSSIVVVAGGGVGVVVGRLELVGERLDAVCVLAGGQGGLVVDRRVVVVAVVVRVVRVVEAVLGEVLDLEGPRARDGIVVDELGVHLDGGLLDLLVVAHGDDAIRVGDGHLGVLVRGPDAVQRDLGELVEAVCDGRLLGLVRIDVHLLAAYVHDLVQVEVGHVGHARKGDAAVVDATDGEILDQAVARLRIAHGRQVLHGRYGEVARAIQHHSGRMRRHSCLFGKRENKINSIIQSIHLKLESLKKNNYNKNSK